MARDTCIFCGSPMGGSYLADSSWGIGDKPGHPNANKRVVLKGIKHTPCTGCDEGHLTSFPAAGPLSDLLASRPIDVPLEFLDGKWVEAA